MNSVLNRTNNCFSEYPKQIAVKRLPSSYYYNSSNAFKVSSQQRIRWTSQSQSEYQKQHNNFKEPNVPGVNQNIITNRENKKNVKIKSNTSQQQLNRSHSTNVSKNKQANFDTNNNSIDIRSAKIGRFESTESIIQMHKFFKEKQIYSSPNDNYKRRTIVLIKANNNSNNHKKNSDSNNSDFGFHLQSYGLINTKTQSTEFICFVDNIQIGSSASQAGLNNGDVLLAIDGIGINEFSNLREIMEHVQGKQELRLVIIGENVCKKIQLQQRMESLKSALTKKKIEFEQLSKQQELILFKKQYLLSSFTSPLSSSNSSSLTNSSISGSQQMFPISPTLDKELNLTSLSPLTQNSHIFIKNSTPLDTKNTSIIRPESEYAHGDYNAQIDYRINSHEFSSRINNLDHQKSSSSPNGTARIKCDLDVTSLNNQISTPTYSASPSSASSTSSTHVQSSFNKIAHKCMQQTSRIVRSASSSSMNILTNLGMGRSARSRNSSMCSTLNDSTEMNECKKSKKNKFLNKSMISDVSRTGSINSSDLQTTAKIVVNNHHQSLYSNNEKMQIKQPIAVNNHSFMSDFDEVHRKDSLNHNTTTLSYNSMATVGLKNSSKYNIIQKKSTIDQILPVQSYGLVSTYQNENSNLNRQFSPISSKNSNVLIDMIDSGIDVGIGLPSSPLSSEIKNTDSNTVAKIISDGGYSSFLYDQSQKDEIYSNSKKNLTQNKECESSNKEYIITKL